jgi:uncharacterized membrane protein YgcG
VKVQPRPAHQVSLFTMVAAPSFLILIVAVVVVVVVVVLVVAAGRSKARAVTTPMCGRCGYQLAPNPTGLTVCPECGGDFLSVGILAPEMKLGRRGSPAVPLGIAWFLLVGVGMVPVHSQLLRSFTKMVTTGSVKQTQTGSGPVASIVVSARTAQAAGEKEPESREADVTLTGADGKELSFTVDGLAKVVTDAPASTGLKGAPWDQGAVKKLTAALGGEDPDGEAAQSVRSVVEDAMAKSGGGGGFNGLGGITSFSSSSSSSGFSFGSGGGSRGRRGSSSASSYSGGVAPVVMIGKLRGEHWVVLMTIAIGLIVAGVGTWVIVMLTREKRRA